MKGKKVTVANFNIVFLNKESEDPLLDYFDSVLMPALTSGIYRNSGDSTFLLMDIEVKQDDQGDHILTGLIVKSTILEVKSKFDDQGNLIERDDVYPTAPFSTFIIYLKNHRMLLVENQKGSPSIDTFRSTVKYILDTYIVRQNHLLKESDKELLPIPLVSIVGIPAKGGLISVLRHVEKVNKLTLKFYPLNGDGDIDFTGLMAGITKEVRRRVGSERGELSYLSPKNIEGIAEVIQESQGTVEPVIIVKFPGVIGNSTVKNDKVSERRRMDVKGNNRDEELTNMISQGKNIDSINYISEENDKIYARNQNKILPFVKK